MTKYIQCEWQKLVERSLRGCRWRRVRVSREGGDFTETIFKRRGTNNGDDRDRDNKWRPESVQSPRYAAARPRADNRCTVSNNESVVVGLFEDC